MCDKYNIGRRTKYLNLGWVSGSGGDQSARGQGVNPVHQVSLAIPVVVDYHMTIVSSEHGLLKRFLPLVRGFVVVTGFAC